MATVTVTYAPATGRQFVDLTSWAGDAAFADTPVAGDQIEGPDTLTMGVNGVISGADGTYTLHHYIAATSTLKALSYTIGEAEVAPQTATVTVQYNPPDDMTLATIVLPVNPAMGDQFANPPEAGEQVLSFTADGVFSSALDWSGNTEGVFQYYYINNANQMFERTLTTGALGQLAPADVPQGTWTIGTITKGQTTASFTPTYSGTDATSYQYSIGGSAYIAFTGTISLSGLSAEVAYSGNVKASNGAGDGVIQAFSFTTDAVPVAPQVPQGVVITQPPTTTQNTAEIYHSYNEADANSFEYSLDNVNWQAASNPLVLTGLTLNTTGTANFRAVNAVGFGAATSINFRTKGETVIIPSGNWKFFTAVTKAPKTWEWGKRHPITNARVRLFKKGQL
jgi:hypothetical protein